jgi:uncharacterized membrane protein YagU involved in acid resistance
MGDERGNLTRGILAGIAGGLVASWVMNKFMAGPGQKLQEYVQAKTHTQPPGQEMQDDAPKEDATMKTANAIVTTLTGRQLSQDEKEKGGPIVHYAFGALMGGVYGAMAEESAVARAGFGAAFGGALFTGADLIAVPALGLSGSASDAPVSSLVTPLAAHLVYGVTTDLVRRFVRAIFQ